MAQKYRGSLVVTAMLFCVAPAARVPAAADESRGPTAEQVRRAELWFAQLNSEFIDVPVETRIPDRFEMYNPHSTDELRQLRKMGFTQVMLDRGDLHRDASCVGLDVVLANWWIDKTTPDVMEQGLAVARAVTPGRLAGFSVMDEPGRNSPDTSFGFYVDLYKSLRARFDTDAGSPLKDVPIEISHAGPFATWDERYYDYFSYLYEAADTIRIMPYPDLPEGPLSDVFFMTQRTRILMKLAGRKPQLVVILQAWVLPEQKKMPEVAELRVMALQAMLSGATVVSFFDYNRDVWKDHPEFSAGFPGVMKELKNLAAEFDGGNASTVMSSTGILASRLTSRGGAITEIALNTNRYSVDDFEPLEVRTKVITNGRPSTPCPTVTSSHGQVHCGSRCRCCPNPLLVFKRRRTAVRLGIRKRTRCCNR